MIWMGWKLRNLAVFLISNWMDGFLNLHSEVKVLFPRSFPLLFFLGRDVLPFLSRLKKIQWDGISPCRKSIYPLQIGKHITMPYLMMITMCFNYKQNASKSKKQTAHLPAKRRHAREKWLVVIPRHSERWCNKTLFTPHPPPLRHQSPLHSLILPQHSSFLNVTPSGIHKTSSSVPYLFLFGFAGLFDLPWNQNSHSQRLRVLHDWSCTTPVTTSTAFLLFFLSLAVAYCSCKILQEMPKETKLPVRMPFQKETFENNINFVQKMKS